jgi:hypothetical protein
MENVSERELARELDQLVDEARGGAVAQIRERLQQFLVAPDSGALMQLVVRDVGLLLDEVTRLQAIRARQAAELARLREEAQAPPTAPAAPPAMPVFEAPPSAAEEPQPAAEGAASLATVKTASESLETALAERNWTACQAALEALRASLGLPSNHHGNGS